MYEILSTFRFWLNFPDTRDWGVTVDDQLLGGLLYSAGTRMKTLAIRSHAREEMIDITREVEACLAEVAQENHPVSRQNTSGSTPPS
jgi:hypothetical protein